MTRNDAEYQRARRERLIADRRCIECTAGLQDTDEGRRCGECSDRARDRAARYRLSSPGKVRRQKRTVNRLRYQRNREAGAAKMRDFRRAQREKGLCEQCIEPRLPGKRFCAHHDERARAYSRNYQRKKRGDAVRWEELPPSLGRRRPMRVPPPRNRRDDEVRAYVPLDEQLADLRRRILVGMRFRDWTETQDLADALEIPSDERERNTATWALLRLVRSGLVERRGRRQPFEHRLTRAGIAEADRLRNLTPGRRRRSA